MFEKNLARVRRSRFAVAATALGSVLIAVGSWAGAAQDKYTLQVPTGCRFPISGGTKTGKSSP